MHKIVLLRHGESIWNLENRFTGWTDVDLTQRGVEEALESGKILKTQGYTFDLVHTSVLKRAVRTMWLALDEMNLMWLPVYRHWRLNERHYGALQGLNKAETATKYGEAQVHLWRRSYSTPPPSLTKDDDRYPGKSPIYASLSADDLPLTECLKDTVQRFLPYWHESIIPDIKANKKVLVVAHGNSIRALIKYLDKVSDEEIVDLNIPTGVPLVYELDKDLRPICHYYLGDQEEIDRKAAAVVAQGKRSQKSDFRSQRERRKGSGRRMNK